MPFKLDVDVKLEIIFDEKTGECKIVSMKHDIKSQEKINDVVFEEHVITPSQMKYGILTFGAKSLIGSIIPKDTQVGFSILGNTFRAKTHNKIQGRIDGLTLLFQELCIPTGYKLNVDEVVSKTIELSYDPYKNIFKILGIKKEI